MNGWVKIHYKLKEWEWYDDSHMVHLFLHLLLEASWKDTRWKGIEIKRGQVIVGLRSLSDELGISVRTLRTCLERLKSTHEITVQTTHLYSIVTLTNYETYQGGEDQTDTPNLETTDTPSTHYRHTTDTILRSKEPKKLRKEDQTDPALFVGEIPPEKPKPPGGKVKQVDFIQQIIDQFRDSYQVRGTEYIVTNMGKERAAAQKLLALLKSKKPGINSADTLLDLREYFDKCMNINDSWLYENMSLPIAYSQINKITVILRNGNERKNAKGGASDAELSSLFQQWHKQ